MGDKKSSHSTIPSLTGTKVYLRPASAEDVANTHHWVLHSEPSTLSCRPLPFRTASEDAEAYRKREVTPDRQLLMVIRKKDNAPVGRLRFFDLNSHNRSVEIGLLVDPDERRHDYGIEAVDLLCRYLFRTRGLNKVYAQTGSFNKAAIGLLEKAGFKLDATLRRHMFHDNEFHDARIYSILQHEFER